MRPRNSVAVTSVSDPKDITVYPEFCSLRNGNHSGISDGPWFCENDFGQIAFVSKEMKRKFLANRKHSMNGMRRTKR